MAIKRTTEGDLRTLLAFFRLGLSLLVLAWAIDFNNIVSL
jgi:uncharacterized membrane protein YidH (DUF202 family)